MSMSALLNRAFSLESLHLCFVLMCSVNLGMWGLLKFAPLGWWVVFGCCVALFCWFSHLGLWDSFVLVLGLCLCDSVVSESWLLAIGTNQYPVIR